MKVLNYLKAIVLFIGMIVVALLVMIFGIPWWGNPKLNRAFIQIFARFVWWVIGAHREVIDEEKIYSRRPAVLIGNHQSGLDFAFIGSISPFYSVIVGKKELQYIPIFGWFFKIAGNLLIQRSDAASSREQVNELAKVLVRKNLTVSIFPEGTRNKDSNEVLLPFKKGAFHIAFAEGLPIIPVVCSSLKNRAVWERFELGGGHVIIKILDPIETRGVPLSEMNAMIDRIHALMQKELNVINALVKQKEAVK